MNGESRPLITDEPVECEKLPVEVQDYRKITPHFSGICEICLKVISKTERSEHVTGEITWKHKDLDRLSPKSSLDTD